MLIVITPEHNRAKYWLEDGSINLKDTIIITDEHDCQKLLGIEITKDTVIARVGIGYGWSKRSYIEDFIKTRIR